MSNSYVFGLIDIISELMALPLLLIDADGNPLYRSSFYFTGEHDAENFIKLRNAFAKVIQKGTDASITIHGLEAFIAEVRIETNKSLYLVAGYYINPNQQEAVLQFWGESWGKEFLAKNLYHRWRQGKAKISWLLTYLAQMIAYKYRIQQLASLFTVITDVSPKQGKLYWNKILEFLAPAFGADWACIVITSPQNSAFYLDQAGIFQLKEPFYCTLSHWVEKTGKLGSTNDLKNNLYGKELLALNPKIKCLASIPFRLADRVTGVLHVATKNPLNCLDHLLLRRITERIYDVSCFKMFSEERNTVTEHALDILLDYLSSATDDENIYSLVLETIVKIMQPKAAALFLLAPNSRVDVKAAFGMNEAELELECNRIQQTYHNNNEVLKLLPKKPQGGEFWEVPLLEEEELIGLIVLKGAYPGKDQFAFVQRAKALLQLYLQKKQEQKRADLLETDLIESLLTMLEACLPSLRFHAEETAALAREFAHVIGMAENEAERIYKAALCHNLGKIKAVLAGSQSGKLMVSDSAAERNFSRYSAEIIRNFPSLAYLAPILEQIEENVDGSGLPCGLREDEIDISARIIRIVSDFVYLVTEGHTSVSEALDRMGKGVGVQYSPYYFQLFLENAQTKQKAEDSAAENADNKLNLLTPRELEVLMLIAEAKSNREIAETLIISDKTVKIHVSNLLKKLGVKDRTEAAVFYLTHTEYSH